MRGRKRMRGKSGIKNKIEKRGFFSLTGNYFGSTSSAPISVSDFSSS